MTDETKPNALGDLLLGNGAVPVPGRVSMYEMADSTSPDVHLRVLEAIRGLEGTTYLLPSDDPKKNAPEFDWTSPDSDTWELPADAGSDDLLARLLADGAWRVYVSDRPAPAEDVPDLFRGPSIAALDFLERYGATVVLDAWHDNTQWRVALLDE